MIRKRGVNRQNIFNKTLSQYYFIARNVNTIYIIGLIVINYSLCVFELTFQFICHTYMTRIVFLLVVYVRSALSALFVTVYIKYDKR